MTDRHDTSPGMQPIGGPPGAYGAAAPSGAPGSYGAPTAGGTGAYGYPPQGESYSTEPQYSTQPVALRRPDVLAAVLLLLAGVAAAISLLLRWVNGAEATGWDLVRTGFERPGELFTEGWWQPLAIVLGGGVLALLGLLILLPARSHRFLGAVALVVSAIATAAVLVPLIRASFDFGDFDLGFWFALAVPVLGLLGSLKAFLTGKKYA